MNAQLVRMVLMTGLTMAFAGSVHAAKTNEYINCLVDVQVSTGKLALELSQSTWDLGSVPQGGVKDTWFGEPTHGKFWVRNVGDTNACIFITAEPGTNGPSIIPDVNLPPAPYSFAMAVATNITDVLPVWSLLNQTSGGPAVYRYIRTLGAGDYMLFDLRFYAGGSLSTGLDQSFRVGVYATSSESLTP